MSEICCSVLVNGERLDVVEQFKYFGVVFVSNLTFKQLVKEIPHRNIFNLSDFSPKRPFLTLKSA